MGALERKILNIKLEDRMQNTIVKQRSRVTDIAECLIKATWALHPNESQQRDHQKHRMADNKGHQTRQDKTRQDKFFISEGSE